MIDLHTHSVISDGTDLPSEVIALGAAAGLSAIALTDHDTLEGIPQARKAASAHGIELVSACEISCDPGDIVTASGSRPGLHVLVYFLEPGAGPLQDELSGLQAGRAMRNSKIVERLQSQGVDITEDEVIARAGQGVAGRPHFASLLVEKGYAADFSAVFETWLGRGGLAYVERPRLGAEEAISLAHASGAVAVIAHPTTLDLGPDDLDRFVARMAEAGLDGIEAIYGSYLPEVRTALLSLAERHGIVATGGSDYHGEHKPGLSVGVGTGDLAVPDEVLAALSERRS